MALFGLLYFCPPLKKQNNLTPQTALQVDGMDWGHRAKLDPSPIVLILRSNCVSARQTCDWLTFAVQVNVGFCLKTGL